LFGGVAVRAPSPETRLAVMLQYFLDVGTRFFVDGTVGQTGTPAAAPGYFDLREVMFWIRFHDLR
jgi:hypothetical protein